MTHTSHSLHLSDLGHRLLHSSLHLSLVANTDVSFSQERPKLRAGIICLLSEFCSSFWDRSVRGSCCAHVTLQAFSQQGGDWLSIVISQKEEFDQVWLTAGLPGWTLPGVASAQQHWREADLHSASQMPLFTSWNRSCFKYTAKRWLK